MITRRRLLWGGVAVAGVAAIGVVGFGRMGFEARIVSMLKRRLAYLKLDEGGLHAFARDQSNALLTKKFPTWNRLKYHFLSISSPSFERYFRSADTRSRVVKAEDSLISTYLLSSDFFINHADESRTIQYVSYYDPMRPCQNPFARPAVDS
jgi:hypothetical protein